MPQQERIFYLDFVRAFATVLIVLTHYNALFLYNISPPDASKGILFTYIGGVYIGTVGVALFLIISGAAFTYVYQDKKLELGKFFKKRFMSIYPMYWIAYIITFFINFWKNAGIQQGIPKKNIVFSVLGIDTYVANYGIMTFATVGEWFIGLIVIIYIAYPLIKYLFEKAPILLIIAVTVGYYISVYFSCKYVNPLRWFLVFVFGMFFFKYIKSVNSWCAIGAVGVIFVNNKIKIIQIHQFEDLYISLCVFVILVYLSRLLERINIKKICGVICKYSYPCFLVHHFIIYQITKKFDLNNISRADNACLFVLCCVIIVIFSKGLYMLDHLIQKYLKERLNENNENKHSEFHTK